MSKLRQAEMVSDGIKELMLLGVKANGAVRGRLLVMTLEQKYRNSTNSNTEITYTFPLPFGAVLMDVEADLNGKVLKGEVSAKKTARARYEEAISEGNSSIMLEKNHDGSFTLELGNLMAREECRIMIRYSQVLTTEHCQVRLMLPTTIAPRYGNPIAQGKLQPHQVPVTDLAAEYPFDITLTLYGDMANTNVSCPSHKTSYLRNKDDLVIKLSQRGYMDRDFILVINNLKNESEALACKDLYEDGQFALMAFFSPRIQSDAAKMMAAKILVDCSSSMAGDSIDAARRALRSIVSGLGKDDKFSLSKFGNTVEHRSRGMWSGTAQAKVSASRWIDGVQANLGGTDMADALVSTIAIADSGKSDILLITDGEIEGINEVIDVAKQSKHRVFVVAIGASPAEVHLRRLATETGGYCDFVSPGEDVEPAVLRMSARMHAARATHIRVEWPQTLLSRWEQQVQSYAFENDVFNVCAFVNAPGDLGELTPVKLWGCIEGQVGEVLIAEAKLSHTESSTNVLARLTAHAKYQDLLQERAALGTASSLSTAQGLAVTYKLVTDETNFILVHERTEAEKANEMPDAHKVPQMLAAGWGGTGSVARGPIYRSAADNVPFNVPMFNKISASVRSADYAGVASPSVWRGRPLASVRVDNLSAAGMDDYEIPAFLRKQADGDSDHDHQPSDQFVRKGIDKQNPAFWISNNATGGIRKLAANDNGYVGITPAGLDRWLTINHPSLWPTTYAELRDLGLGLTVCEWLEFEVGAEREESAVVSAFLSVIHELGLANTVGLKGAVATVKRAIALRKVEQAEGEIAAKVRVGLNGAAAHTWPKLVIDFPACASA
jgi:Ca-activated chloride channel family protein